MGASKETLEELLRSGTDGSELMFCMDTGQQTDANIEMIEKQLKLAGNTLLCMRLRQRLTSEAEAERKNAINRVEWKYRRIKPGWNARRCAYNTRWI